MLLSSGFVLICLLHGVLTLIPRTRDSFTFASARCEARCLTKYGHAAHNSKNKDQLEKQEKQCIRICKMDDVLLQQTNCNSICSNEESKTSNYGVCLDSCSFITNVITAGRKSGKCAEDVHDFYFFSDDDCADDWDCPVHEKCCRSGINKKQPKNICYPATFVTTIAPFDIKMKNLGIDSCSITWTPGLLEAHPVIYVVEKRFSRSKDKIKLSYWTTAGQEHKPQSDLKNLIVGAYYQFRIAAVTEDGFNGYSNSSEIVKLPFDYRRSSKPHSLRVEQGGVRNNKINVVLTWQPPLEKHGVIKGYRVMYYQSPIDQSFGRLFSNDIKINVPATKNSILLRNLKPNTTYEVKISARTVKEGYIIRGRRGRLVFTTQSIGPQTLSRNSLDDITWSNNPRFNEGSSNFSVPGFHGYHEHHGGRNAKYNTHLSLNLKPLSFHLNTTILPNQSKAVAHLSWRIKDTRVNNLLFELHRKECLTSTRKNITTRRYVAAQLTECYINNLNINCQYTLLMYPYYNTGVKGKEVKLNIDTSPPSRHSKNTVVQNNTKAQDIVPPFISSFKSSSFTLYRKQYQIVLITLVLTGKLCG